MAVNPVQSLETVSGGALYIMFENHVHDPPKNPLVYKRLYV